MSIVGVSLILLVRVVGFSIFPIDLIVDAKLLLSITIVIFCSGTNIVLKDEGVSASISNSELLTRVTIGVPRVVDSPTSICLSSTTPSKGALIVPSL